MYSFVISVQFVCRKTDNIDSRVTRLLDVCDSIPGRGKILLYRNARGKLLDPFSLLFSGNLLLFSLW